MTERRRPDIKILTRRALLERYGAPRSFRLIFTNGCFDVLHRGHVEYLALARELGDALVVGLNTDVSVARLKGSGRPYVDENDRAIVLAGLESVDAVTLFDTDTPRELIGELLPDVLVKGGDYEADTLPGRDEVIENGGEVVILPFVKGRSTTDLVDRIRRAGD